MIEALREGRWATNDRLIPGALMAIALYMAVLVYLFCFSGAATTPEGIVRNDFLSFWVAARNAINGTPEIPYELAQFAGQQKAYLQNGKYFAFFYPPTFLLVVMPLGLMGALTAYAVFQLVSVLLAGLACARILHSWHGFLLAAALPATFNAAFHGQSALLCAALLGAGLVCLLEGRMILAGVFIGLLTIKPQMGVLIPIALLAGGYYRTFASAAVTAVLFAAVSWLVFGTETWLLFIEQGELARTVLQDGRVDFHKMISVFAAARLSGLPTGVAYWLQAAAGLVALFAVWTVWRRPAPFEAKAIVLISAGYLATPFVLSYDLAALSVAIAFAIRLSRDGQVFPWMWALVGLACAVSIAARPVGSFTDIPIGPLAAFVMLWVGLQLSQQRPEAHHQVFSGQGRDVPA